jgi:hypothetical protein
MASICRVLKCFWFAFAKMVSMLVYESILSEQNKRSDAVVRSTRDTSNLV